VFVAQVDLDALPAAKPPRFVPLPEYPSVSRDLVFLFPKDTVAENILQTARKAGGELLSNARIFDRYTGKGIPDGKVSLGVRFTLQAADRTLTQDEADQTADAIVAAMGKQFGAALRT
jgi:phenylalanyl-tRNA synthetase beta chain